jgi:hypothetical protein
MHTLDALIERTQTYSAFADNQRLLCTSADLSAVVAAAQQALTAGAAAATVFYDATGERTEVEARGDVDGVRSRLLPAAAPAPRPGPGRPRLGVVSREVSLLPRHWDWLAAQPGGASAALRRLIEQARKSGRAAEAARGARDAAARAMSTLAGDRPHFEEALRALYRGEFARVTELTAGWPEDLRAHVGRLTANAAALQALLAPDAEEPAEG